MTNVLRKPTEEIQNKITLWLNHLLVLYTFLIPINNNAKSSMFFVMLVLFLYRRSYWKYLREVFNNKIVQAILLFYIFHVVGMLYTDNIDYGKSQMDKLKYLLFPLVFLSFLDKRFVIRVIIAFIIGMSLSILFSYLVHYGFLPYSYSIGKYEIWETFAYSPAPFLSHGEHGVGIALLVGVLLYYILNFENQSIYKKIIASFLMIFALINIFFIASRVGYLTLIGVVLITLIITYKRNFKLLLISITLLSIGLFFIYQYSPTVHSRVDSAINNFEKSITTQKYYENGSTAQRIGLTLYSIEVIKENPILGVGTGDHMDLLREKIPDEEIKLKEIAKPHNLYVQIPMQVGIVGVLAFIYMIYVMLSYHGTTQKKKDIMIIFVAATLIFMAGGMLYGTFELPLLMVFISAMIATKKFNIELHDIDRSLVLKYFVWIVLFLIIGITR